MIPKRESMIRHLAALRACRACPAMQSLPISGRPVLSRVILIGQAPGVKEPLYGRPFAWTAGKTMFQWFQRVAGVDEESFRDNVYMAAVCRCYPGKTAVGSDRVPNQNEIDRCSRWMEQEFAILRPQLVIPVGKLAIGRFLEPVPQLQKIIGSKLRVSKWGRTFDLIPLPHPSGASPWHRIEPGRSLTEQALRLIAEHPAWRGTIGRS
jgi:uracil-DNA glycosylase